MKISWQAYFKEFSQLHGGSPVVYLQHKETGQGGYLLFRDGWCYSRKDPSGPEYAPKNKKDCLTKVRNYWIIREAILQQQYQELKEQVRELAEMQDLHSAPLQTLQTVFEENDEGLRVRKQQVEAVDFRVLLEQLRELKHQIEDCKSGLLEVVPEVKILPKAASVIAELEELDKE